MIKNMGNIDRWVRVAIGVALIVVAALTNFWWLVIGSVIMFGTAALNFCPLYLPFRFSTRPRNEA